MEESLKAQLLYAYLWNYDDGHDLNAAMLEMADGFFPLVCVIPSEGSYR